MGRLAVDNMDLVVLTLADAELGDERSLYYEDLAVVYGDEHLFNTADSLRRRKLLDWGSSWVHCWLTEDGRSALERSKEHAA